MYKILIIEDDRRLAEEIGQIINRWGYEAVFVTNFQKVEEHFIEEAPHLVLLDIHLPFYDGYHWCRRIRTHSEVPILFITSASDKMSLMMAVHMGGDDFLTKPFEGEILQSKIMALLRRTYNYGQMNHTLVTYDGIFLDMARHVVVFHDKESELTKNEARIMELLIENGGKIVEREILMKRLWDNDCFVDDNTLTVNVTRLKRKLEPLGIKERIVTRKGVGYELE